jgi:UDP-2-acetamido-3-amino-2,3-dideoxy-glucuronate N-acetyltransferase
MTASPQSEIQTNPRIAVIGAGNWGRNLIRNFRKLGALSAICDTCEDRRLEFAERYPDCPVYGSAEQLLCQHQLDAVAIATPAETHGLLTRQVLLAGKDVFIEKPLCLSVAEGRGLVDLARKCQKVLMVGHLLWYHGAILKLQKLINSGQLGKIKYVYSNRLNLGKIRRDENILWSFAPHDISVMLGLLQEMPSDVHCEGGDYIGRRQVADVTISHLSFPSGIDGHIFVSWLHPFKEQKLVVVGDRQMAVFDDLEEKAKLRVFSHTVSLHGEVPVANKADAEIIPYDTKEPLRAECEHFLECIDSRTTPRTDGEEGLRVLEVLQRCQQSLECDSISALPRQDLKPARFTDCFVHESAYIDEDVEIGTGSKIWHVSHIMPGSRLGSNCNVGQNVVIGPRALIGNGVKIQNNVSVHEGVTLEDNVFCGPSVVFTNVMNPRSEIPRIDEIKPTLVKQGATLGANCTIVCGVTIGRYAFVGAGAVVTTNVPDHALVYGNPARIQGWVCQCGEKLDLRYGETCRSCGEVYSKPKDRTSAT